MEVIRALKMRIYPDDVQKARIDSTIDSCRFVYNHMLARNRKVYDRRNEHLSYNEMQNLLPAMKTYLPWLREADSQALKHACRGCPRQMEQSVSGVQISDTRTCRSRCILRCQRAREKSETPKDI